MAANEFEKNVQRIMDEFRLHPSQEVWEIVEKRIQEKKRKRRILFFIIFSFMGLALAGYGIYNSSEKQRRALSFSKQGTGNSNHEPGSQQPAPPQSHKINERKNNTGNTNIQEKMADKKLAGHKTNGETPKKNEEFKSAGILSEQERLTANHKVEKKFIAANNLNENKSGIHKTDSINKVAASDVSLSNGQLDLTDSGQQKRIAVSAQISLPVDSVMKKTEKDKPDTALAIVDRSKDHNKKTSRLKWGLTISAGSSSISGDRFSFRNAYSEDKNFSYNPGGSPGTSGAGSASFYPPYKNRPGFAFRTGAIASQQFSKRSHFMIGVNYVYLSDQVKIGIHQASVLQVRNSVSISSYYGGAPQKYFTDRFHFLELPIIYDWRMTRNANHFLSLDAGVSPVYLLSTNALVYDTSAGGVYYHDKNLFTRTHFNFIFGLSYHVAVRENFEFKIGPEISFDLSRTFKTDIEKRKYFLYGGINASLFFEKKKKK
jgi:hypothetical protein